MGVCPYVGAQLGCQGGDLLLGRVQLSPQLPDLRTSGRETSKKQQSQTETNASWNHPVATNMRALRCSGGQRRTGVGCGGGLGGTGETGRTGGTERTVRTGRSGGTGGSSVGQTSMCESEQCYANSCAPRRLHPETERAEKDRGWSSPPTGTSPRSGKKRQEEENSR